MSTTAVRRPTKRGPAIHRLVANILATYERATPAECAHGGDWYGDARRLACTLDPDDPKRAAAVIAVLSPRLNWERNAKLAIQAYETGTATGALPANCDKANRLLRGHGIEYNVRGDKVKSFYANIIGDNAGAVTIDRHAYDVARGRVGTDKTRAELSNKGVYAAFVEAYRRAAVALDIDPVELQATTWLAWRRLKKIAD